MFNKSKIVVATLITGLTFGASAQASEVSIEQFVSAMMSKAISTTQQELRYSVEAAVLTASNAFSLVEETTYFAKVTITDLESEEPTKSKAE